MISRLVGLLLAIGLQASVVAQNYLFKHFGAEDGLQDKFINSITQCQQGFLWFSTSNGLMRYDGQHFEKLETGIKSNDFIVSSLADAQGNLLFGTFEGKVVRFSKSNSSFSMLVEQVGGSVNKILPSKHTNSFYILSKGHGVYLLSENKISLLIKTDDFLINDLHEFNRNHLLLSTSSGLLTYDIDTKSTRALRGFDKETGTIWAYKNQSGSCWVNIPERGILKLELTDHEAPSVSIELNEKVNPQFSSVANFYFDEENNQLFMIGKDERLSHFNLITKSFQTFNENEFFGSANYFFIGRQKNLWIGTAGKGLYRVRKAEFDLINTEQNAVFAIAEDTDGKIYLGIENGIRVTNHYNKLIETITQIGGIALEKVSALYFDGINLWIGTSTKGLFVLNTQTKLPQKITFSTIKNIGINSICGDKRNVIVTTNLDGVYIYKEENLQYNYSVKNSLLHNNVFHAIKSKAGKTYYATHNTAFNYSENGQLYEIDIYQNGLISDYNVFAQNSKGEIFVGTNGDGIYMVGDTAITPFEFNSKLESKYISGLQFDANDHLWIQHQYGLQEFYPQQKVLRKLNFSGINQLLFNGRAYLKTTSGDLYFGTSNGAVRINAAGNAKDLNYAKANITRLKINATERQPDSLITLSYGKYNVSLDISAIGHTNSENIQFTYYLEGRDNFWCEPTRQKHIEFANLGEGNYTFKLKAINSEGFEEDKAVAFTLIVGEPFWKKPWVWIMASLVLGILVVLIVKWRTASLVRVKLRLEEIVENQTKQLRTEKELIEQNSKLIEEQNHEITQSINYAKRIQEAILPVIESENANQPQLMIFYLPKDIVSGDFYWHTTVNNHFLVAACDCTGHGVPGAFMSLIGSTTLNKIVIDKGGLQPNLILKEMDDEISKILKQDSNEVRDGMETGICSYDVVNKTLHYAGAKRPLWVFSKTETAYQLQELNASKFSIGGFAESTDKVFAGHQIKVNSGDTVYMFSDGIIDQFDANNKKRIGTKRVREFMSKIVELSISEQKEALLNFVLNWRGKTPQTDDILVIGIRF